MVSDFNYQEEAAKYNLREFSERGKELGRYVEDLYAAGAKMWTKDMFRDIEAELAKQPRPETVMVRSMNGVVAAAKVPGQEKLHSWSEAKDGRDDCVMLATPRFRFYQDMLDSARREETSNSTEEEIDDETLMTRALILCLSGSPISSLEYEEIRTQWDEASHNWSQSAACKELTTILTESTIPKANKIVCFGLGRLSDSDGRFALPDESDGLPKCHAMTQHAAALTMATLLGKKFGTDPLSILAQDPAYTSADKKLFAEIGIKVAVGYGSLAFTEVDDECMVFSVCPNICVKQVVADIARPAAMIWNRVTPVEEETTEYRYENDSLISPWTTDQDSPRTRKLVEDYSEIEFPTSGRFCNLKIYIRKD